MSLWTRLTGRAPRTTKTVAQRTLPLRTGIRRTTLQRGGETLSDKKLQDYWYGDENPDNVLVDRGFTLEIYDRMMQDDKIAGIIRLKKGLLLGSDWEIKGEDEEAVEFCKRVLDGMRKIPFADVLDNMLDSWIHGFKLAEIIWKTVTEGGRKWWLIEQIKPKRSERIKFHTDEFGNLEYAYVRVDNEANRIDLKRKGKYALLVNPYVKDGNWYGESDLRPIYREWRAKDALVKWRTIYMQNFAAPTTMVRYDQKLASSQREEALQALKDWQEFGQIRVPCFRDRKTNDLRPLLEIEFLEPQRRGQADYTSTIQELDKAIARQLLIADKLGFTEGATGSYALAQTQLQVVMYEIARQHARLEDMVNTQILAPLCEFNGLEEVKMHFVGMGEGLTPQKVDMIKGLKDAGLIDKREPWVRELLGIPPVDEELLELWESQAPPPAPPANAPTNAEEGEDEEPTEKDGKEVKQQAEIPPNEPLNLPAVKEPNYLNRVNYKRAETFYTGLEKKAVPALAIVQNDMANGMVAWLAKHGQLEGENMSEMHRLPTPARSKRALQAIFQQIIGQSFFHGRLQAHQEIKKVVKVEFGIGKDMGWEEIDLSDYMDRGWLKKWLKEHGLKLTDADKKLVERAISYSFFLTGEMDRNLLDIAKQIVFSGMETSTASQLAWQIKERVKDFGRARNVNIVRTNSAQYWNNGRYEEFDRAGDLVVGGQYSAILDPRTTEFCRAHHGKFLLKSDAMYGRIPPAHYQCRSTLSPVFAGEDYSQNFADVPASASQPQKGFGV